MNQALQIISIQYELIFALTESPELKRMLQQFLRVCNSRLNLSSSHIFIYHDKKNHPSHKENVFQQLDLKHYASLPNQQNGDPFSENVELLQQA